MRLPESVKIGPYRYAVERVADPRARADNRPLNGDVSFQLHLIRIDRDLTDDRALATFFHEVMHGLDDSVCAGLTEKQIDRISVALTAFLVDNDLLREPA